MDYYCVDCHAPVCSGDDSVWCNWCQSSTHRFCGNGLRIDDEQYLAYKRGELKIFFSCKICTGNLNISYQGEVTFYQTPSVPKNGMNNTSIEFEIADLDVVSDNEIKEQLLKQQLLKKYVPQVGTFFCKKLIFSKKMHISQILLDIS